MKGVGPSGRLTDGALLGRTLRFGLPLALGMAAHGLFNCVDLVIVGRLGEGAVAAVTLGGVINMLAMLAMNGVTNVFAGQAADLAGRGEEERLQALERAAERLTLIAGLVLGVGFAFLARPLVAIAASDERTAGLAVEYLVICSLGSGTMFVVLWGAAFLRARGASFWPMAVLIGSNVLNLVLDLLLVFGLLGFPRLGVAGAAWATVLSRLAGALVLTAVLHRARRRPTRLPPVGPLVREALRKGLVNALQTIARVVGLYLVLAAASRRAAAVGGELAARDLLDGTGVAIRLEMVLMFAALGFGAAAASFLAQNLAAGRPARAAAGLRALCAEAFVFALLLAAALWLLRDGLFALVAPGTAAAAGEAGAVYLARLMPVQPFLALGVVLSQALVGLRSVKTAVAVDLALYGLLLPLVVRVFAPAPAAVFLLLALVHVLAAGIYLLVAKRRLARAGVAAAPARGS